MSNVCGCWHVVFRHGMGRDGNERRHEGFHGFGLKKEGVQETYTRFALNASSRVGINLTERATVWYRVLGELSGTGAAEGQVGA